MFLYLFFINQRVYSQNSNFKKFNVRFGEEELVEENLTKSHQGRGNQKTLKNDSGNGR